MAWDEKGRYATGPTGMKIYSFMREPWASEVEAALNSPPVQFTRPPTALDRLREQRSEAAKKAAATRRRNAAKKRKGKGKRR